MAEEITGGNDLKLSSEVLMSFDKSIQEADKFAKAVGGIQKSFAALNEAVMGIDDKRTSIFGTFAREMKNVLKGDDVFGMDVGKSVSEKIVSAMQSGLLNRDWVLDGFTQKDGKLIIDVGDDLRKRIETRTREAVTKAVQELEIEPITLTPYKVDGNHLKSLQKQFTTALDLAMMNGVEIQLQDEKSRKPVKFIVDNRYFEAINKRIGEKFSEMVNKDKSFVEFKDISPITIDSEQIREGFKRIKESLVDVDNKLFATSEQDSFFKDLPDLRGKLEAFQKQYGNIVGKTAEMLDTMTYLMKSPAKSERKMAEMMQRIEEIKVGVFNVIDTSLQQYITYVLDTPMSTVSTAKMELGFEKLLDTIDLKVFTEIEEYKRAVLTAHIEKKATPDDISKAIVDRANEAIKSVISVESSVNTSPLISEMETWATGLVERLASDIRTATTSISVQTVADVEYIFTAIKNLVHGNLDKLPSKLDIGNIELLDNAVFQEKFVPGLRTVIRESLNNADVKLTPVGVSIEIGSDEIDKLSMRLKSLVEGYVNKAIDSAGVSVGEADAVKLTKSVEECVADISSHIMTEVRGISSLVGNTEYSGRAEKATEIQSLLNAEITRLLEGVKKELVSVLSTVSVLDSTVVALRTEIEEYINKLVASTKIDDNVPVEVVDIRKTILLVMEEMNQVILRYVTQFLAESESIGSVPEDSFKTWLGMIESGLRSYVEKMVGGISARISSQTYSEDFTEELRSLSKVIEDKVVGGLRASVAELKVQDTKFDPIVREVHDKIFNTINGTVLAWNPSTSPDDFIELNKSVDVVMGHIKNAVIDAVQEVVLTAPTSIVDDLNILVTRASERVFTALLSQISDWAPSVPTKTNYDTLAGYVQDKLFVAVSDAVMNSLDKVPAGAKASAVAEIKSSMTKIIEAITSSLMKYVDESLSNWKPKSNISKLADSIESKIISSIDRHLKEWKPTLNDSHYGVLNRIVNKTLTEAIAEVGKALTRSLQDATSVVRDVSTLHTVPIHEMTSKEFAKYHDALSDAVMSQFSVIANPDKWGAFRNPLENFNRMAVMGGNMDAITDEKAKQEWKRSIEQAAEAGEKIPERVMREYLSTVNEEMTGKRKVDLTGEGSGINLTSPIVSAVDSFAQKCISGMAMSIKHAPVDDAYKIKTNSKLMSTAFRKDLAHDAGMSVKDFKKAVPAISGDDIGLNMQYLIREFNELVNRTLMENISSPIIEYKKAIKDVKIVPDLRPVRYLSDNMVSLQEKIIAKVKQMINEQFRLMEEQVKAYNIRLLSLGAPSKTVAKASASVVSISERTGRNMVSNVNYGGGAGSTGRNAYRGNSWTEHFGQKQFAGTNYTPGGDTHSFMGSVINTMRYMTAGMFMGVPMMAMYDAMRSISEADYQIQRATANFRAKDEDMSEMAAERVKLRYEQRDKLGDYGVSKKDYTDKEKRQQLVDEEAADLRNMSGRGASPYLQRMAMMYGTNMEEPFKAYQIESRRLEDPNEALAATDAATKLFATEPKEGTVEEYSKGLEAIMSQWGMNGYDMDKVSNMIIKAGALSQASAMDLIKVQERAGAIFDQNTSGMSKEQALAASLALSNQFVQSTALSGEEGGTFFRTILKAPFETRAQSYLTKLSKVPGYEKANPWIESEDSYGRPTKKKKNAIQMFEDLADVIDHADDKTANDIVNKVFKNWHSSKALAVISAIKDQEKKSGKTLSDTIKEIQNVKPEDVYKIIARMQDTYGFKKQQFKTMWQITSFNTMEEMKGQFNSLATQLTAFLRAVGENTSTIANLIDMLGSVAGGVVLKVAGTKLIGLANEADQKRMKEQRDRNMWALNQEGLVHSVKMEGLMGRQAKFHDLADKYSLRQQEVADTIAPTIQRRDELVAKRNDMITERDAVTGVMDTTKHDTAIAELDTEIAKLDRDIKKANADINGFARSEERALREAGALGLEIESQNVAMANLTNRVALLNMAYDEMGLSGSKASKVVSELEMQLKAGTLSAEGFSAEIRDLAREAGVSDNKLANVSREVDKLTKDFDEGKLSIEQYILAMRKLQREQTLNGMGGRVGGVAGAAEASTADDLLGMVIAGSMFGKVMKGGKAAEAVTVGQRIKGIPVAIANWAKTGAVAGAGKAASAGKGLLFGGKQLLKGAGPIMLLSAAWDTLSDPIASSFLDKNERAEVAAEKGERMSNQFGSIQDSRREGRWGSFALNSLMAGYDSLTGSVSHMLGGTGPGAEEYLSGWGAAFGKQDVEEKLQGKYKWQDRIEAAKVAKMVADKKYLTEHPELVQNSDGSLINVEYASGETAAESLKRIDTTYQPMLDALTSNKDYKYYQAKKEGYSDESDKVRDLQIEFINNTIDILSQGINDLKDEKEAAEKYLKSKGKDPKSNPYVQQLETYIKQKEAQREEERAKREDEKAAEADDVSTTSDRRRQFIKANFGMKQADAILAGANEDSPLVKAIGHQGLLAENQVIGTEVAELRQVLAKNKWSQGDERAQKILLQIAQLQAEARDNLVKIHKELTSGKSTFNLPSGIKPMTYWEYKSKDATHKPMSVQVGDVVVQFTVENMNGTPEDAKRASEAITKAGKSVQQQIANALTNSVRAGVGSGYVPMMRG